MNKQGSSIPTINLADNVLQNIYDREALIQRLENLHSNEVHGRGSRVQRLLYGIHNASLAVVEAITAWNVSKQDEWYHKKNIQSHASLSKESPVGKDVASTDEQMITPSSFSNNLPSPFNTFLWNGQNYLHKMLSDLDFVGDITEAISFLGSGTPFHRNPLLLPVGIDQLGLGLASSSKIESNIAWKDVNMQRVRRAAFVILLDEHHRGRDPSGLGCLRRHDTTDYLKFYPPQLESKDLEAYTNMVDPPASVAVAICCAHLVLGSVDTDITDKLIYLTKAIVLKIFRQPLTGLLQKARICNPLRHPAGNENIITLVHPFVMHHKMNPELMDDVSEHIVHLMTWLRTLVTRLVDDGDVISSRKNLGSIDQIICELEVDGQRGGKVVCSTNTVKEDLSDDANKENECACRNVSVQTEDNVSSPTKQKIGSTHNILNTFLDDVSEQTKKLVPYPVPITVNVNEGSQLVEVNGGFSEASAIKAGDVVRIFDAHESSNWIIAEPPQTNNDDGSITLRLRTVYDHSRIVAQEKNAREDTLNRLCYPYKKEVYVGATTQMPSAPTAFDTNEESIRHVACDRNESIHSPLHIREARIWKLIPEEEDTRTAWRRDFDDGLIPWRSHDDATSYNKRAKHFRVRVSLEKIAQSCIDSPYPLDQCIHQQRVNYFENVPLANVIDEAFYTVCRWHPKGNLIDNVKWAKLSRKMKFLSNVKNANHEIDMAFVRRNQDRKLDLARFHAIFDDIASIQYPSLTKKVCSFHTGRYLMCLVEICS